MSYMKTSLPSHLIQNWERLHYQFNINWLQTQKIEITRQHFLYILFKRHFFSVWPECVFEIIGGLNTVKKCQISPTIFNFIGNQKCWLSQKPSETK